MVSERVTPLRLYSYPFGELGQTPSSIIALVFDIDDDPDAALFAFHDGLLPTPSWMVINQRNRHFHVGYGLALPIHKYPGAKLAPLHLARRVAEYFRQTMKADPGFPGILTRNPAPRDPIAWYGENTVTSWGPPEPYWLDELGRYIPPGWRQPARGKATTGIGRNHDLFCDCMSWAGRAENANTPVIEYAREQAKIIRARYFGRTDHVFPESEVEAIARSVERYREHWAANDWHCPRWIEKQANRGRRSGEVRREATEGRDRLILAAYRAGYKQVDIARSIGLSPRAVHYIINRDRARPEALDLSSFCIPAYPGGSLVYPLTLAPVSKIT